MYLEFTRPRQERRLREVVSGNGSWESMLPRIHPLPSAEALQALLPVVQALIDDYPEGVAAFFVQPMDDAGMALSFDDMVAAVHATSRWEEFIHSVESAKVHFYSREYPRCWIVAAQLEPGFIGSGIGFIVDKHSRTVLPRRYVDVSRLAGISEGWLADVPEEWPDD